MSDELGEEPDLEEELSKSEVALAPSEAADPQSIVNAKIPGDIRKLYDVYSYRGAAVILSERRSTEFNELLDALRSFRVTKQMIRTAGRKRVGHPQLISTKLRPLGWYETVVQGDLLVRQIWREQVRTTKAGKAVFERRESTRTRERYLDGHKIDYVKGRVAFDLEWNSKDQTFDRDLYAFSAFAQCGVVDAAVLVTRSASLNPVFRKLGEALKKDGTVERKSSGEPRMTFEKYGASTTWMGKLLYRLNAGRNGGCPVLVFGITPACIKDWSEADAA
jgi:hypothetical protein